MKEHVRFAVGCDSTVDLLMQVAREQGRQEERTRMIERPLHWPEALTNLIDALRDFIESDSEMGATLLAAGSIAQRDYDVGMRKIGGLKALLAELEDHAPDPSLDGLRWHGGEPVDV
ncbi:MAG TPA: hypothetical protein VGR63_19035 [Casimicrobiaceae bacterium]|jgi:hypothetical protein|nr:hypothetical protein [Casimicrobiaceae bacterium]